MIDINSKFSLLKTPNKRWAAGGMRDVTAESTKQNNLTQKFSGQLSINRTTISDFGGGEPGDLYLFSSAFWCRKSKCKGTCGEYTCPTWSQAQVSCTWSQCVCGSGPICPV